MRPTYRKRPVLRFLILSAAFIATALGTRAVLANAVVDRSPVVGQLFSHSAPAPQPQPTDDLVWPSEGSAALHVAGSAIRSSNDDAAQPIASLAKVMTAYVVLVRHTDVTLRVRAADLAMTRRMAAQGQSYVPVEIGEILTEHQALQAILLPSANNVAVMLAGALGGQDEFVAEMNAEARTLGMSHTTYTDPSGFDEGTVSTARDQTVLADAALKVPALAAIVQQAAAVVPVAGPVLNTNRLVGSGWVGLKTGSDQAAGGCLMFAKYADVGGRTRLVTGTVLGQRQGPLIQAGLDAGEALVGSLPGG